MPHPIVGLHHVTATVDTAQTDLDFFRGALGLRLVKKTVNFDNPHVYHFYYGTEIGHPGTLWTTFPYGGHGVPAGTGGAGQIRVTAFSVAADSLGRWADRLKALGIASQPADRIFDEDALEYHDPSGMTFRLVGTDHDDREPWTGSSVPFAGAIRGLHSVTLLVHDPAPTLELLERLNGRLIAQQANRFRVALGAGGAGAIVDLLVDEEAVVGRNGIGTVHHVAFAIGTSEEQLRVRADLVELGYRVTPVRDRQYFQSIYFREPGGALFEVATVAPGFQIDEDRAALGTGLKLPPWEEPNRPTIEAALPAVTPRDPLLR